MNLGDRMKQYEIAFRNYLPNRLPVIIRVDGKCFHSFTKRMERPFDPRLENMMATAAIDLYRECQGCRLAYVQSDEISLLLWPWLKHESQAWFDNELPKIISLSASIATASAVQYRLLNCDDGWGVGLPHFDSRAFILPEHEVENYFIWRQQDWERNSINMLAQHYYTHQELMNVDNAGRHEMLYAKGVNWANLPTYRKTGTIIIDDRSQPAPIFKDNRELIRGLMNVPELP